jgi:hypothetical protein
LDAKLLKMLVQSGGRTDVKLVDDDLAGAVGEAPPGRVFGAEQNPGTSDLSGTRKSSLASCSSKSACPASSANRGRLRATKSVSVSSTQ